MTSVDDLKKRMLDEFEAGKEPDIAAYVRAAPEARDSLLDYWVLLISTPRLSETRLSKDRGAPNLDAIELEAVRDLGLAASLGSEWLLQAESEREAALASIGAEMERLRDTPYTFGGKAPVTFRRIAVYGWITGILSGDGNQGVSRMRVQKVAYLLENGLELGIYRTHKRHRYGPYDSSLTYRDAEPGCLKKGYLVQGEDHLLRPGPKHFQAEKYAVWYVREETVARALIEVLRVFDEWTLETLTTVHAICAQLNDTDITVEKVMNAIAGDDSWRDKLQRSSFTPERIAEAIRMLTTLRLT